MRKRKRAENTAPRSWPAFTVERWPIERLRLPDRNARRHGKVQIEQLRASMRAFGWTMPVLAREDGEVIAGAARLEAALAEGYTQAPVIVAIGWTEEQCRAYALADNKLALLAEWDADVLRDELGTLSEIGFDLSLTGFGEDELERLLVQPKEWPEIADGERPPFRQMTFNLHETQVAVVEAALDRAKAAGPFDETVNGNSNGNALARIAEVYARG